ncbi:hypothetical protein VP1G_08696 [Cytospora mali]|uniref:Luciferase domain-containing protein n=1 Tax=Cytospora mali TaxID=578113 RepID=A0A194VCL1_CYTMA|nr:hypothetical protein VP1G_08696 [Valsa mali var. pyri (nom. inval.)]
MDTIRYVEALFKERPLLSSTAALILGASILGYLDYRSYVALGPHGLPDTFWGWYRQLCMSLKSRKDTTIPAPYDLDSVAGPHDRETFLPNTALEGLSWRPGNKPPHVPGFVAPQRQTTDIASGKTKKAMYGYLDALVAANPGALQTRTSVLEGPVPAMAMRNFQSMPEASRPEVMVHTRGEMCHIHPPDGSTHLLLSLADQKRVIELGWGRRHRLSGGGMLPWNYTFIYAPRNEEEMDTWKSIVVAGARFCCADVAEVQAPVLGS